VSILKCRNYADCRKVLQEWGFRQVTYRSQGSDEFWFREGDASKRCAAAEVARSKIYTYEPHTNAYAQIASIARRFAPKRGRPPSKDEEK
jgi:hypothetical protein